MTLCFPSVAIKTAFLGFGGGAPTPGPTLGGRIGGWGKTLGSVRGMGMLGAGIGAAKGLIAPGEEYDEYGRPHQKGRIGAMLSGAGTGALVGGGVGMLGKMTGAGKAVQQFGAGVDAGTAKAPDWAHSAHEAIGGSQSPHRQGELFNRAVTNAGASVPKLTPRTPGGKADDGEGIIAHSSFKGASILRRTTGSIKQAAPMPIPVGKNLYHVTQPNGVQFHFEAHGANPATGELHGFHIGPNGEKTQSSFIAAHAASIKPITYGAVEHPPEHTIDASISQPKAAALRLVRDDIYLVAATNGEGFIGSYKGASADDKAVFLIHAPGIRSIEAAFDMRKLAHISPVVNEKTGSVARSRDELPFTNEGQKLAEAYAFKEAKRKVHPSFAEHQFKKKKDEAAGGVAAAAETSTATAAPAEPAKTEPAEADPAPAAEPAASATMSDTSLPKLRAKSKKK